MCRQHAVDFGRGVLRFWGGVAEQRFPFVAHAIQPEPRQASRIVWKRGRSKAARIQTASLAWEFDQTRPGWRTLNARALMATQHCTPEQPDHSTIHPAADNLLRRFSMHFNHRLEEGAQFFRLGSRDAWNAKPLED